MDIDEDLVRQGHELIDEVLLAVAWAFHGPAAYVILDALLRRRRMSSDAELAEALALPKPLVTTELDALYHAQLVARDTMNAEASASQYASKVPTNFWYVDAATALDAVRFRVLRLCAAPAAAAGAVAGAGRAVSAAAQARQEAEAVTYVCSGCGAKFPLERALELIDMATGRPVCDKCHAELAEPKGLRQQQQHQHQQHQHALAGPGTASGDRARLLALSELVEQAAMCPRMPARFEPPQPRSGEDSGVEQKKKQEEEAERERVDVLLDLGDEYESMRKPPVPFLLPEHERRASKMALRQAMRQQRRAAQQQQQQQADVKLEQVKAEQMEIDYGSNNYSQVLAPVKSEPGMRERQLKEALDAVVLVNNQSVPLPDVGPEHVAAMSEKEHADYYRLVRELGLFLPW
eukprot:m51a1_g11971 hypothetical protein (406) ;mRNA; f:828743-829960